MLKFIIHPNEPEEQAIELEAQTILIGSSDENDLIISHESVSSHHCRIEERDGIFHIVDLSSGRGLAVDGEQVDKRSSLPVGSLIDVGDVTILFKGKTPESMPGITEESGFKDEHALVTTAQGNSMYLPSESFIQPMTIAPEKASAGMLPLLSLILSILGPVLFGIGIVLSAILGSAPIFFYGAALFILLVGIVFGFVSRAAIRRRGGFVRDQQVATWGLHLSFGWLIIFSGVLGYFGYAGRAERQVEKNERLVRHALTDIAVSQAYVKHSLLIDKDDDLIGEYADLDELVVTKYSRVPGIEKGAIHGYKLSFQNIGEDGFLVTAAPEIYRSTGKESYYIDEEGVLRGEDIGGEDPSLYKRKSKLPKLNQEESIYEVYKDELAGDIFKAVEKEMHLAEKDSENKVIHYRRAESIVQSIRKHFPLSDVVADLDAIDNITEPVIIDFRANEDYNKALSLLDDDNPLRALEVLKRAESLYPTASNIIAVRELISSIQEKHLKELEARAKELYGDSKKKELDGDFDTAFENYKKIRDNYGNTSYADGIDSLIEKIQAKIKEKEAEEYVVELRSLSVDKDYKRIISVVEVITRGYTMTDIYSRNFDYIEDLEKKAHALVLVSQGLQSFEKKDYRAALQTFEKAIEEFPDIRTRLKRHLEVCYLWVGKYTLDEKDYRKALDYFIAYRRSNPEMTQQQRDYLTSALNKTYYEVGKLDYQQGNYKEAEDKLFVAAAAYSRDPEFSYIYGSVLLEREQYRRAIEVLSVSIPYKNFQMKAFRKRGYARIEYAFALEDKLRDILIENEEYQYLLDLGKIKAGRRSKDADEEEENDDGENENTEDNKEEDGEDNNLKTRFLEGRTGSTYLDEFLVRDRGRSEKGPITLAQAEEAKQAPQQDYPLFRILRLIEEVEKSKDEISQEEADSQGNQNKRKQVLLKKTRMVEKIRMKFVAIKVGLDKENTNKEHTLNGIKTIATYFSMGIEDIEKASLLSVRNRDVEEVLAKLRFKIKMYNNSYSNLLSALQNEKKLQATAIANLEIAIDQFTGWSKRVDISRNLKYAFLMTPSKEAVATGLEELTRALEVDVETSVILRSGGIDDMD